MGAVDQAKKEAKEIAKKAAKEIAQKDAKAKKVAEERAQKATAAQKAREAAVKAKAASEAHRQATISRAKAAVQATATAAETVAQNKLAEIEGDPASAATMAASEFEFEFTSKPLGISLTMQHGHVVVKKVKRENTPIAGGDMLIKLGGKDLAEGGELKDVFAVLK